MSTADRPAVRRVIEAAAARGLTIDVHTFPEGTKTAPDAARAVGCDVAQIVKTLVFVADATPVIAMVSGRHRLDPAKLARVSGARTTRRAHPDEVRAATGFAIGGTPPFGHPASLGMYLDETLLGFDEVWCAAGTPDTVFPVAPGVLREATGATVADFHHGE